jgi:CubicO group peptidase (beta-lactamase class C family)
MDGVWLNLIDGVVERGLRRGDYPGAVVLIGRHGKVVFERAYGDRLRVPQREPMTVNTMFDIASLTKVVATAPAILQLQEAGKLRLEAPLGELLPACNSAGRRHITVRQLLAHDSGLRAVFTEPLQRQIGSYDDGVRLACAEEAYAPPGMQVRYSDLNYILLGEIVRHVSGEPLDAYSYRHIIGPLGLHDTYFNPPRELLPRIAGTDVVTGQAADGVATRMGGVAGHSGLYSTAGDLAIYCAMLLNGGQWQGVRILSPQSVRRMTTPAVHRSRGTRGLGFDIASGYSGSRGDLFPCDSFGHTGYSGVSMWLDRRSDAFVIILTNRLHPDGNGDVRALRAEVATIAAGALKDIKYERAPGTPLNPARRCRAVAEGGL